MTLPGSKNKIDGPNYFMSRRPPKHNVVKTRTDIAYPCGIYISKKTLGNKKEKIVFFLGDKPFFFLVVF